MRHLRLQLSVLLQNMSYHPLVHHLLLQLEHHQILQLFPHLLLQVVVQLVHQVLSQRVPQECLNQPFNLLNLQVSFRIILQQNQVLVQIQVYQQLYQLQIQDGTQVLYQQ